MMNNRIDTVLVLLGILIIADSIYTTAITPILSIVALTCIMSYLLISGVLYRMNEVKRIKRNSRISFWEYRRQAFDWQTITAVFLLFYSQTQVSGTLKYLILIMGFAFLLLLVANIFIARTTKSQILAIEGNKIINIRIKVDILNLSKFHLVEKSDDKISLKNRWRSVMVLKEDFVDNNEIIDALANKLLKKNSLPE